MSQAKPGRLAKLVVRAPQGQSVEHVQSDPILILGMLLREQKVVEEKLKGLHLDPAGYHGNLQVMLSSLRRMQGHVEVLINQCEGVGRKQ